MSTLLQPILILYSHGRNPPLNPSPDLKYDLRNIPNPPKALRDVSDGRSKRLREHLLSEPKFVQKLDAVEADIRQAMQEKMALRSSKEAEKDEKVEVIGDLVPKENAIDQWIDGEGDEEVESRDGEVVLRVGCNCALGHHRSVAFVSELHERDWPKEWAIEVVHRDLHEKRTGGKRGKQKAAWKDKRRNKTLTGGDEDEDRG